MKILLIFLLVFSAASCFGQGVDTARVVREVDSLIQVSRGLTDKQEFDKALEINAIVEKVALEKLGRESAAYGSCSFNYGRVLYLKGDYTEAEKWYLEAKDIQGKMLGKEHSDYAKTLNGLANLYNVTRHYESAEPLYLEAMAIWEKVLGKEHPDYASYLSNMATLYNKMGRRDIAERHFLEVKTILEKVVGKEHADYASNLNNLAILYMDIGRYENAELLFREVIAINVKINGKESIHYAGALNNLALLYSRMNRYAMAEPLMLEALSIKKKVVGNEHPDYTASLLNLANIYCDMHRYDAAETLYLEVKSFREKVLGKESIGYAHILHNLASLYEGMGRYESAELLYIDAKTVLSNILGKDHPDYATCLSSLANLYSNMGYYENAEQLYLEVKSIREKAFGKEQPEYASIMNDLAHLYTQTGRYKSAELLLLGANAIWGSYKHPDYAGGLGNLANVYMVTGRFSLAEQLYLEANAIREKILGKEHPGYATGLNDLAALYYTMGQYSAAEPLFLEANTIWKKTLEKEHPDYAAGLSNLAALYQTMERYGAAEPLIMEAKTIREETLGEEHPDYAASLINLGDLYWNTNAIEEAVPYLSEANHLFRRFLARSSRYLSEQENSSYSNLFNQYLDYYFSFTQIHLSANPSLPDTCFNNALFYKGFLLIAVNRLKRLALSDTVSTKQLEILTSYHRLLSAEYAKPIAERQHVPELEEKSNTLEKELARTVAGFGEAIRQVNWQEVQTELKSGEAAIEFSHYRFYNPNATDSIFYSALVLRPEDKAPSFVPLFEEREITPWLKNASGGNVEGINTFYTFQTRREGQKAPCDLIWKPLEGLLKGVNKVYCSPSGLLHRLNLGAIPVADGQPFSERHALVLLGSTRQLTALDIAMKNNLRSKEAVLIGGIRYDSLGIAPIEKENEFQYGSLRGGGFFHGESGIEDWKYLEYSEQEVKNINPRLAKAGYQPILLSGIDATEESFKNLGQKRPSPAILHIATHGFFYPDPKESTPRPDVGIRQPVFRLSDNPMMRSGLILAGANCVWQGNNPQPGREDGILTAYEISQMNLSNTELVVLSACETGLGDIQGNEGVYGLQRAFKIAGAKYLIMSLWAVNDLTTSELMIEFYRQWLEEKLDIPDAFRAAQLYMREKYPDAPYLWAGFVLVE